MRTKRYFDEAKPAEKPSAEQEKEWELIYGPSSSKNNEKTFGNEEESNRKTFPNKTKNKRTVVTKPKWVDERMDPFPGDAPIKPEIVEKYAWGEGMKLAGMKTKFAKSLQEQRKKKVDLSMQTAARSELLLHEDAGFIEPDEGKETFQVTQKEIVDSVDIQTATKYFELDLPRFGPYRTSYTRNGRHLLIGGKRGHVATFDWQTKKLHCEMNVTERVKDVQWLHVETMFAVAQKRWTYIYDKQGVELHCLKQLFDVQRLEFLPYHFLLVASTGTSFLHWLDVSMGKLVKSTLTKEGSLQVMCQNPANAIIHCGHAKGTVTMWSPNMQEPVVKMLCHAGALKGVTVDSTGTYMATTGIDSQIRIWDIRQHKELNSCKMRTVALGEVAFSQRKLLACGDGTNVQIFKGVTSQEFDSPYLVHDCKHMVTDVNFCPFEDVLGVGHQAGFTSVLVPGAGEANIDALEANPYQSKSQRKEYEVKALLDKIQSEMINLETSVISQVDTETLEENLKERAKLLYLKPEKIDFKPKHKMKGRSKSGKVEKRKKGVIEEMKKVNREQVNKAMEEFFSKKKKQDSDEGKSVLDRFKRKDC